MNPRGGAEWNGAMPLMRYFLFVGAALIALLCVFGAAVPTVPVADQAENAIDLPVIRIHSDRKWPERIVFDTRVPPAVPVLTQASAAVPAAGAAVEAKARVLDAFAQLQPPAPKQPAAKQIEAAVPAPVPDTVLTTAVGKPEPKLRPKRKIARIVRTPPPMIQVAQQPRFGFFANDTW
jgi:hypothetical protein